MEIVLHQRQAIDGLAVRESCTELRKPIEGFTRVAPLSVHGLTKDGQFCVFSSVADAAPRLLTAHPFGKATDNEGRSEVVVGVFRLSRPKL